MKTGKAALAVLLLVAAGTGVWFWRAGGGTSTSIVPTALTVDHRVDPVGIDSVAPHLSWMHETTERNWRQSAYQLLVATDPSRLRDGAADVWDSGRQPSDESHGIAYGGPALESGRRYYWTVRTWDAEDRASRFAPAASWEMGLLAPGDWAAQWVAADDAEARVDRGDIRWIAAAGADFMQVPLGTETVFRLDIELAARPDSASLYLTTRGDFTATVNGHPAGVKTRSWVAFDREDITDALVVGPNVIEVRVKTALVADAPAPANGRIPTALAGLVKVEHADGRIERFGSSARWQSRVGTGAPRDSVVVAELGDGRFPDPGPLPAPAALLRRGFDVAKAVARARLYVTALGSYRMFLNGTRVGDDVLTPDFTDYRDRVVYQTYDVTPLLREGRNAMGAVLGDGWYASAMSWYGNRFFFGPAPTRLLAQLDIEFADGTRERVASDATWKTAASAVQHSEIYAGEVYDARREAANWATAEFDDTAWATAMAVPAPGAAVVSAQMTTPVRVTETVTPVGVTEQAPGVFVFDMGQNMVGWARLNVEGPRGTRVRLRYAERLDPDGRIYRDNFRNANATGVYVLKGGGPESYAPLFTFYGFRYVEVTGFPGVPTQASIAGEVVTSVASEPSGTLETSSDLVNRFWQVGVWGQKGNFLSVPTDCPQRDERLGWTGDAAAFWRTGAYNFDIAAFTRKWLQDVRDAQSPAGSVPNTVPHVPDLGDGAPGWGDAVVIVPWTSWMQYGDRRFIDENWDAMEKWMRYIAEGNPDLIRRNRVGWNFSDWLAPDERTSKELVGTAYWALIADQMVQMADATGRADAAGRYRALHDSLRAAFQKAFVRDDGKVDVGTQTSYVLALNMRLVPDALVPQAVDRLVAAIEERDWHLSTGFLGTPYLLFALTDNGRADVAYRLLLNETFPSWGYMVRNDATTWWERWNSDTSDPAMNSYNHYAFGSVVAWVYRYVAGIDTSSAGPGFKRIVIRPRVDARVPHARGEYQSAYGRIATDWTMEAGGRFTMRLAIPANTAATVYLPASDGMQVYEGGQPLASRDEAGARVIEVGSGEYAFEVR